MYAPGSGQVRSVGQLAHGADHSIGGQVVRVGTGERAGARVTVRVPDLAPDLGSAACATIGIRPGDPRTDHPSREGQHRSRSEHAGQGGSAAVHRQLGVDRDVRDAGAAKGSDQIAPPHTRDRPLAGRKRSSTARRADPGRDQHAVTPYPASASHPGQRRAGSAAAQTTTGVERQLQTARAGQSGGEPCRQTIRRYDIEAGPRHEDDTGRDRLLVASEDRLEDLDLAGHVEVVRAGGKARVDHRCRRRHERPRAVRHQPYPRKSGPKRGWIVQADHDVIQTEFGRERAYRRRRSGRPARGAGPRAPPVGRQARRCSRWRRKSSTPACAHRRWRFGPGPARAGARGPRTAPRPVRSPAAYC